MFQCSNNIYIYILLSLKSKREGLCSKNHFSDLDIYLWNKGTLEHSFKINGLHTYTTSHDVTKHDYSSYDLFCNQTIPQHTALTGKGTYIFRGGKSTGPVTKDGRKRCAVAKTVHGYETRAAREYRAKKFRELKRLFDSMYLE